MSEWKIPANKITVLKMHRNEREVLQIENSLAAFQELLGGPIEAETLNARTVRICREGASYFDPMIYAGYCGTEFTDYFKS